VAGGAHFAVDQEPAAETTGWLEARSVAEAGHLRGVVERLVPFLVLPGIGGRMQTVVVSALPEPH
jgi:hypothetical protein